MTNKQIAERLVEIKIKKEALAEEEESLRTRLQMTLVPKQPITVKQNGKTFIVSVKEVIETTLADNKKIYKEIGKALFVTIAKISKTALTAVKGKEFTESMIIKQEKVPRLYVEKA